MTATTDVSADMRQALRRLAKAVVVITARHQGARFAMAATAVSELSLDPPSLLICVNQTASLYAPLFDGADFCVNILDRRQEEIARTCSGAVKGEARFGYGEWGEASTGAPRLRQAQATFVCRNEQSFSYGTHRTFVGRVVEAFIHGRVDPLIYCDQQFGGVALNESPPPA